jgi:hypothetical protein
MDRPTEQISRDFQDAYDYFNRTLFSNSLPNCLITMQRKARSYGYFRCQPFVNRAGEHTDEISLNPMYFASRTDCGVLSTLVHEMAHLRQYHFGQPGRRGYHNRPWANEMIGIGLYPSATGNPGGKETGYRVSHYIVEHGRFDVACAALLSDGFHLSWIEESLHESEHVPPTVPAVAGLTDSSHRWKYTCPQCDTNAWAKPLISLICGDCLAIMARNPD